MRYTTERREAVLKKMVPPHPRPISQLAKEEGISEATLYKWRQEARQKGVLLPDADTEPEGWNARDKFTAVVETAGLNETELGEYCRKKGMFPEQVHQWRLACESANDWDKHANARLKSSLKEDRRRIRDLEKDLKRKEKALAEAAAFLMLQKKVQAIWGGLRGRMISAPDRRKIVMLINEARQAGARLEPACEVAGISNRTYQRWTGQSDVREDGRPTAVRPEPANKLTREETEKVLSICHDPEFASLPPGQIVPRLADNDTYIASESTFYRILHQAGEQHHRGRSRAPRHSPPPKGFCATGPNQVWSWDVTWLPSQIRGMYFYLYMIVDVYSRKIVGWEVHSTESAELGAAFIHKAILAQVCILKPPVIHADNGGARKGYTIRAKMDALGVTKSYSRPRVSNDNPFSESLFRTCKYRPDYPWKPFESIEGSRQWVASFVRWYNYEHLHSGIRFVTPEDRHTGRDKDILENRDRIYREAKQKCPKRWSGDTRNWEPKGPVWLNPPKTDSDSKGSEHFPDGFRQIG